MNKTQNENKCVMAVVKGKVQGVGFRAYVQAFARDLGLSGWVRNLPDRNTVEVMATGKPLHVQKLLAQLRLGPPTAQVVSIEVSWHESHLGFTGFVIQ